MTFLSPLGALALLAVPAILLLYFLKVRRPELKVGALLFWRRSVADRRANAPWQRLRASLLLFLQLAAAAALALALIRPGVPGLAGVARTTVVVIDASASMRATDVSPSRFAVAVEHARQVGRQAAGGEVALILAGTHAELLTGPTADPAILEGALARARPAPGQGDLGEALSLAAAVLAGRAGGAVEIIGDGHGKPPGADVRLPAKVHFTQVGSSGENAAIEALSRTGAGSVYLRAANYGRVARDLKVEFRSDGRLVDVQPLHLDGNSSSDLAWNGLPAGAGVLEARLTPGDAFSLDDSAWLVTAAPATRRVLLVTAENGFLERALSLRTSIRLTVVKPAEFKPGDAYDLYVFDGFLPEGSLPQPALVVNPPAGKGPVPAGPAVDPGAVLPAGRDPITQDVVLRDVHVQTASKVSVPAGWRAPVTALNDSLLLVHDGEPRLAELTFDVHHSDLPLRAAFPILVRNLLDYLLPGGFENQVYQPGRPVALAPEPSARAIFVTTPAGRTSRVAPPLPPAPFADTSDPGVYTVRQDTAAGSRTARFVVQFADPGLSRINPGGPPPSPDTDEPPVAPSRGLVELWPWLAAVALGLLLLEWVVAHRGAGRRPGRGGGTTGRTPGSTPA